MQGCIYVIGYKRIFRLKTSLLQIGDDIFLPRSDGTGARTIIGGQVEIRYLNLTCVFMLSSQIGVNHMLHPVQT